MVVIETSRTMGQTHADKVICIGTANIDVGLVLGERRKRRLGELNGKERRYVSGGETKVDKMLSTRRTRTGISVVRVFEDGRV